MPDNAAKTTLYEVAFHFHDYDDPFRRVPMTHTVKSAAEAVFLADRINTSARSAPFPTDDPRDDEEKRKVDN